ncbi:MAG: AAA family ATPase, partial [Candidatus Competibacteraceae bacterium]
MNEAAPAHRKLPIGIQTFAKLREDDCYYVDKFSKVSLFSGLNNLSDITVDAAYSAICGYTEADIDTVFAPELAGLDRARIRQWYNGYNWTGEAVYN